MTTRDRIKAEVAHMMLEVAMAADDSDLGPEAEQDLRRLYRSIFAAWEQFNLPTGPDPMSDGGPTREDLEGTVTHDIG